MRANPFFCRAPAWVYPAVACGTMRLLISGLPLLPFPVTAVMVTPPVIGVPALVMKHLPPSICHSPARNVAVVWWRPLGAGLRLGQAERPQLFAARERGQVFLLLRFRSEQQNGVEPSDTCAAIVMPTDASARPISITASAYATVSAPAPPYFSGNGSRGQPQALHFLDRRKRKFCLRIPLLRNGAISPSANSRHSFCTSSCSDVRSKSIPVI